MKYHYLITPLLLSLAGTPAWSQTMSPHHDTAYGHDDAIGQAGTAAQVSRTIKVDMHDNMRFSPETVRVKAGDTVRFVVSNNGKIAHEMVFGTDAQLQAHYAAMLKHPDMEHADDNQITLAPGKSGELIWTFNQAGSVNFACLQPGHYSAGMKGRVVVDAVATAAGNAHKH